ncbi:MAG: hypothetical protein AAFZ63_05820 [Bacteroidota bacterium]
MLKLLLAAEALRLRSKLQRRRMAEERVERGNENDSDNDGESNLGASVAI